MGKKEEQAERIRPYVDFIKRAEALKSVERTAWTAEGRRESTAEHSWRLALLAGVLAGEFPEADLGRVLMMCLIHDIGEIGEGDVSAALGPDPAEKYEKEREAALAVFALLPQEKGEELAELWEEYGRAETPEARLVKALDKAETIIQHNQGRNPLGFDYEFNLSYGAGYFEGSEALAAVRGLLDRDTGERIQGQDRERQKSVPHSFIDKDENL